MESNTHFINKVDGRVDTAFTQISQVSDKAQSAIDITAGFNNQMARLEIRVDDMGSEINATADTVNIHSSTLNAHSDSINIIADCVRISGVIRAGVLEAHEGYFEELKAGTGTFGSLYAKKSEISSIVTNLINTEQLNVKNITARGTVSGADGDFDVGNFGSCTITNQVELPSRLYIAGYRFHIGTIVCKNGSFDAITKV